MKFKRYTVQIESPGKVKVLSEGSCKEKAISEAYDIRSGLYRLDRYTSEELESSKIVVFDLKKEVEVRSYKFTKNFIRNR